MAPHDLARERAPLPVPAVRPCVAPRYEPSGPAARQALAGGGALGADWRGRSSFDSGARRPGPGRVMEYRQHHCPGRRGASADQ